MLRDVVVRASHAEMNGDETIEVWLKEGAGAWGLEEVVAAGAGPTQDFELPGLTEGEEYVVQFRTSRGGRYRAGYLSANPDVWPDESQLIFIPGSAPADVPTITGSAWARTAFAAQATTIDITPNPAHLDLDVQLLRNGVVVATQAAPHAGPFALVDANPPLAESHSYTARHVQGSLLGAQTVPEVVWSGPAKPTGFAQVLGGDTFYQYEMSWDTPPGTVVTRLQDDYACMLVWGDRGVSAAGASSDLVTGLEKNSSHMSNGNVPAEIFVRARHEETTFGVTDVSDWTEAGVLSPVDIEIANDETAYHACL